MADYNLAMCCLSAANASAPPAGRPNGNGTTRPRLLLVPFLVLFVVSWLLAFFLAWVARFLAWLACMAKKMRQQN